MSTPTINTARLQLRAIRLDDAEGIYHGWAKDPIASKYLPWLPHENVTVTTDYLQLITAEEDPDELHWLMTLDGLAVGSIRLGLSGHKADLGYVLSPRFWRQGLMSEAVAAVIEYAFAECAVYRLWAVCDVENQASAGVLEKVGMQKEGVLRGWLMHPQLSSTPRDCACYSKLRD